MVELRDEKQRGGLSKPVGLALKIIGAIGILGSSIIFMFYLLHVFNLANLGVTEDNFELIYSGFMCCLFLSVIPLLKIGMAWYLYHEAWKAGRRCGWAPAGWRWARSS